MIKGLSTKEQTKFSLERDKENPTVWTLGFIPSEIFMLLEDQEQTLIMHPDGSRQMRFNNRKIAYECFRAGVIEAENLLNGDGQPLRIEHENIYFYGDVRRVVKKSVMDQLDPKDIFTIGFQQLYAKRRLSEDEAKNSNSQPE
jgi:hypothetical protein